MSKLNTARIVNLSYNRNTMRINNETFEFGGESTLVSLRNGGGKTVMVQMLLAPFVRRRNLKDRIFTDYFTTSSPTYLMTEWLLDNNSGYVLIGMAVRKKTLTADEDSKHELDIVTFVHEYASTNDYDIHNMPVVEQGVGGTKVKRLSEAKKLMEELRTSRKYSFDYYDLSIDQQRKRYFERLKEFNIYQSEWEKIIQKINTKESGLSELFSNSKTINALISEWFLPAIEDKLNENGNRIRSFQQIINKFIFQLKENESKLELKKGIEEFGGYADLIQSSAEELEKVQQDVQVLENEIANLYNYIRIQLEGLGEARRRLEALEEKIGRELMEIEYEKLSYDYHLIQEKIHEHNKELESIKKAIEALEADKERLTRDLGRLKCSKLYGDYVVSSQEVLLLENKIESLKKSDEQKQAELQDIGYSLQVEYTKKIKDSTLMQEEKQEMIEGANQRRRELKELAEHKNKKVIDLNGKIEVVREQVKAFMQHERVFQSKYADFMLQRNIMNEYDAEALNNYSFKLEKQEQLYSKLLQDTITGKTKAEQYIEKKRGEHVKIQLKEQETISQIEKQNENLQSMEVRCEAVRKILRYCSIGEERLFDKVYVLKELENKIQILGHDHDNVQREADRLRHLLEMYESGKNIKLPEEFEKKLNEFEIPLLYGFTWLKKQPIPIEDKLSLVRQNPFLPYSILMEADKIELLKTESLDIFTSMPIPIVQKDKLNQLLEVQVANNLYSIENMNFFIAFNEKLLDEEELRTIIDGLKKNIRLCDEEKEIKKQEISKYTIDLDEVSTFSLTKEAINAQKAEIHRLENERKILEVRNLAAQEEVERIINSIEDYSKALEEQSAELNRLKSQRNDYKELVARYEEFKVNNAAGQTLAESINALEKERAELLDLVEQEEDRIEVLKSEQTVISQRINNFREKQRKYGTYITGNKIVKDIEDLEAAYKALQPELGLDVKEYRELLDKECKRFGELETALTKCQDKYELSEQDYKDYIYDPVKEDFTEKELENIEQEIKSRELTTVDEEKEIAKLTERIKNQLEKIKKLLNLEYPIPKEQIINLDFTGRRKTKEEEKRHCADALKKSDYSTKILTTNMDKLEDYKDVRVTEEQKLIIPYTELEAARESMIREYKWQKTQEENKRSELADRCNGMASDFNYKTESYFKNTIDMLLESKHKPEGIKQILATIKDIHHRTILQLQSDLNRIDEEKLVITNAMLDYAEEIYKHMDTIDGNSTIKIEERPYKMLTIEQPEWVPEISLLKLKDLVERVIKECKGYLDMGKSIDDILEREITTANLYDDIVGINNVDVKLRKIETSRVLPISWNEVAQNSGGEGFVSAFIVLVCLLSYMRRDENMLINTKEEGKVLIMDNPFAQTNAEHLLKPLTDIAKKYNTQLICFTGLGGDSIYNRFDNIYVMNLLDSKLHQGIQVIESEHKKGEELTQLTSTRFLMKNERYEQLSLF